MNSEPSNTLRNSSHVGSRHTTLRLPEPNTMGSMPHPMPVPSSAPAPPSVCVAASYGKQSPPLGHDCIERSPPGQVKKLHGTLRAQAQLHSSGGTPSVQSSCCSQSKGKASAAAYGSPLAAICAACAAASARLASRAAAASAFVCGSSLHCGSFFGGQE